MRFRVIAAVLAAAFGLGVSAAPSAFASSSGARPQNVVVLNDDFAAKALAFMKDADHKASNKMCGWPGITRVCMNTDGLLPTKFDRNKNVPQPVCSLDSDFMNPRRPWGTCGGSWDEDIVKFPVKERFSLACHARGTVYRRYLELRRECYRKEGGKFYDSKYRKFTLKSLGVL